MVTAESCTGGYLAYLISKNTSASSILERGFVSYSSMAKKDLLKVTDYAIQTQGMVSAEVAREMAEGALKNSHAQLSVVTTGIDAEANAENGPGLIWVGCASYEKETMCFEHKLKEDRQRFIKKAALLALQDFLNFIRD